MAAANLAFYMHTHWDREWYWSFSAYRAQLVRVVKKILAMLDAGELPNFMLDGQTCLLDDLFEVEPELLPLVAQHVASGRLAIGPWYVLGDQMLVSGESLLRNLALGLYQASKYGANLDREYLRRSMVGYCPDTFGHSADMPLILQHFGIDKAVVWRGVPYLGESADALFHWVAPNGQKVLTLHLGRGYYQTGFHENVSAQQLGRYLGSFFGYRLVSSSSSSSSENEQGANSSQLNNLGNTQVSLPDSAPVRAQEKAPQFREEAAPSCVLGRKLAIIPVGGDHVGPPENFLLQLEAGLASMKKELPQLQDAEISFLHLGQLLEQIGLRAQDELEPVRLLGGELRDNKAALSYERAYMLPAVLSTRLYLKRANRHCEYLLTRKMEPFNSLLALGQILPYPHSIMAKAWQKLLRNQPHDSICGCSIDSVHKEMEVRSRALEDELAVLYRQGKEALSSYYSRYFAEFVPEGAVTGEAAIVSSSSSEKPATAADLSNPSSVSSSVVSSVAAYGLGELETLDPDAGPLLIAAVNSASSPQSYPLPFTFARKFNREGVLEPWPVFLQKLEKNGRLQIGKSWRKREAFMPLLGVPQFKELEFSEAYVMPAAVAPLAISLLDLDELNESKAFPFAKNDAFGRLALENAFLRVWLNDQGNLIVAQLDAAGQESRVSILGHRFIDEADGGDTYNFDPLSTALPNAAVEARLVSVSASNKVGPLVAALNLTYEIDLPVGLEDLGPLGATSSFEADCVRNFMRSKKTQKHLIETEVLLKANVPMVFFETRLDNMACDHRLSVLFCNEEKVGTTWSENHFSLLEREHKEDWRNDKVVTTESAGDGKNYNNNQYDCSYLPHFAGCDEILPPGCEAPLDRYPCQRFFLTKNWAFLNFGLPEYGVHGSWVSYTILRAVSYLSRSRLRTRGGGAGPDLPVPEANCHGMQKMSYALAPFDTQAANFRARAYDLAELYEGGLHGLNILGEQFSEQWSLAQGLAINSGQIKILSFCSPLFVGRAKPGHQLSLAEWALTPSDEPPGANDTVPELDTSGNWSNATSLREKIDEENGFSGLEQFSIRFLNVGDSREVVTFRLPRWWKTKRVLLTNGLGEALEEKPLDGEGQFTASFNKGEVLTFSIFVKLEDAGYSGR